MRESALQDRERQPLEDPRDVVGRLFLVAAERAGSRPALCRHLGLTDAELQRYMDREALPAVEVTLRAVDLVIDERTLRGVSARIWRALLLCERP